MGKEKADGDKLGWFARWSERRKRNKLRASEIGRRVSDARAKGKEEFARRGGGPHVGGF